MFLLKLLDFIGFSTASLYTLVPAVFLYILKLKLVKAESLSILGILFMYINAFIYFFLSVLRRNSEEIEIRDFCNLAGVYFGFIYLFLYLKYLLYQTEKLKFFIFISIIILASLLVFYIEYLITKDNKDSKSEIIEWVGVIFNILEYLPIGFNLVYLIKNKVSNKFTLFSGLMGLINTSVWIVWAIVNLIENNNKIHSLIANIFGLLLSLLQICIYYLFRNEVSTVNANSILESNVGENEDFENKNDKEKKVKEPEIMEEFI